MRQKRVVRSAAPNFILLAGPEGAKEDLASKRDGSQRDPAPAALALGPLFIHFGIFLHPNTHLSPFWTPARFQLYYPTLSVKNVPCVPPLYLLWSGNIVSSSLYFQQLF